MNLSVDTVIHEMCIRETCSPSLYNFIFFVFITDFIKFYKTNFYCLEGQCILSLQYISVTNSSNFLPT